MVAIFCSEEHRPPQHPYSVSSTQLNLSHLPNKPFYRTKTPGQVVQYVGFVDCEDIENGHGTHVAGSAAGALAETSPGEHFGDGVSNPLRITCVAPERGTREAAVGGVFLVLVGVFVFGHCVFRFTRELF